MLALRRGDVPAEHGFSRVPNLRLWDLHRVGGVGLHELRGGDLPARIWIVELPFLHHRNLLGRRRNRLLKLPPGDLRAQHGRRELFQLRGGHVPPDQRRDRIGELFQLRTWHVFGCWVG